MLPAWADAARDFSWAAHLRALGWSPDGAVALAETIVGRHAAGGGARPALRWLPRDGGERTVTYGELADAAGRFARFLVGRGVRPGDRVAGFMPRVPEALVAMVGTWTAGAVYVPIFTGFGPDAVGFRVRHSGATVLCTHAEHRARVPDLPGVTIVVAGAAAAGAAPGTPTAAARDVDFAAALAGGPPLAPVPRRRDEPAVLLYTSGSTGPPKGVQIASNFLLAVQPWLVYGLDLQADDIFWPTGDPGWGYGLVCYMAALARGVPVVCQEAQPTAETALARLGALGVTNLATTPTLLRAIMARGEEAVRAPGVRLRRLSSCGEPLNAEVVGFFRRCWSVTPLDHYGSSEFGLPIGNASALAMEVRPGSMGLPFPGCTMAVVDEGGREVPAGVVGQIAMRPSEAGYYSLGYWADDARAREQWRGGWMTIGDLARRDADGYFWFEGRADDVIKSAGYRIGPFEVESAILQHPAVAEAAVVGTPDALRGQSVTAYVVVRPGVTASPGLSDEIVDLVRTRVGRHQAPREVVLVDALPKTESGKIQRFLLRQR